LACLAGSGLSIIPASRCKLNHGNDFLWVMRKSKRRKGVTLVTQKRGFWKFGARIGLIQPSTWPFA
jgi:hypothetical protein